MRRIFPWIEVKRVSIKKHLYSYPALKLLQSWLGVFSSTFATLNMFWADISMLKYPVIGDATFIKTAESGIDTITSGF